MSEVQNDTTVNLIRAIVEHMKQDATNDTWSSLAMVLTFGNGTRSSYGFLYLPDGTIASTAVSPYKIKETVQAYFDGYFKPGEAIPAAMLVQFDRTLGQYEITFEDTDAERWNFTPDNFNTFHELIRPNFNTPQKEADS